MSLHDAIKLCSHLTPDYEPFDSSFEKYLEKINNIVVSTNEEMEGNIFYFQGDDRKNGIASGFKSKRQNYAMYALSSEYMVEIGFNAGHSALLALSINPKLNYTGIDICQHAYTKPCYLMLKEKFGDRINLIKGDSTKVIPYIDKHILDMYSKRINWVIDGGHGLKTAAEDIQNIVLIGKDGETILFDDTDHPPLRNLLNYFIIKGDLIPVLDTQSQVFLKIQKHF